MVLDWKALPTYAGFYLARELGAFERRGIDISFTEVQGATPAAELVARATGSGSARRAAWQPRSAAPRACDQEPRGLLHKTPSAIFTRSEDRIAHPRDLYGKTVGLVKGKHHQRGVPRHDGGEPHRCRQDQHRDRRMGPWRCWRRRSMR